MDSLPKRLIYGARYRAAPQHVGCRARCAFCYESRMTQLFPWVKSVRIPPYDDRRYGEFRELVAKTEQWEQENLREPIFGRLDPFDVSADGLEFYSTCDTFSTGLTNAQIEELVKLREGDRFFVHTVGLDADPDFIAHLTRTYPDTLRVHLSIVTFNPAIREGIMHPGIDVDALRRICTVIRDGTLFLIHFGEDQILADVSELEELTTDDNGVIYIHKLYHNRLSARRIVELSKAGERGMRSSIERLSRRFPDSRRIVLSPGSEQYAQHHRRELRRIVGICQGEAGEAVFCSPGAHPVFADHFRDSETRVIPLASGFGGNIDFIQGTTVRTVIHAIERLASEGTHLRRVYLPDSMFWICGRYDLRGETVDTLRSAFPEITVVLLEVPTKVIHSTLTLEACRAGLLSGRLVM